MIAFLSGGQDDGVATDNLNVMNDIFQYLPWYLSFSFGRELQHGALRLWAGGEKDQARMALLDKAEHCSLATRGELYGNNI